MDEKLPRVDRMKKITLILLPAIIIIAVLVLSYFYTKEQKKGPETTAGTGTTDVQKRALVSFDIESIKFQTSYKVALVATRQKDVLITRNALKQTVIKWRDTANYYKENQPFDYIKTTDWANKINSIFELIIKADNFFMANNFAEAHNNLFLVGQILRDIRKENGKKMVGDDMLNFYEYVKLVADAPNKAEAMKKLMDLKLNFTILKEYNLGPKYNEQIQELEKIIGEIDKLAGPDFEKAKSELEPAFNKLFLQFG